MGKRCYSLKCFLSTLSTMQLVKCLLWDNVLCFVLPASIRPAARWNDVPCMNMPLLATAASVKCLMRTALSVCLCVCVPPRVCVCTRPCMYVCVCVNVAFSQWNPLLHGAHYSSLPLCPPPSLRGQTWRMMPGRAGAVGNASRTVPGLALLSQGSSTDACILSPLPPSSALSNIVMKNQGRAKRFCSRYDSVRCVCVLWLYAGYFKRSHPPLF
jgi:hypothetical protein